MLKVLKSKGIMLAIFLVFYLIYEILTFKFTKLNGIPKYLLLDMLLITIVTSFTIVIKSNKITLIILSCFMTFFAVIFITNGILYKIFGDIFSIEYLNVLNEAGKVFEWHYLDPFIIFIALLVLAIYITVNILLLKFYINKNANDNNVYVMSRVTVFSALLLILCVLFEINLGKADNNIIVGNKKIETNSFVKSLTKKAAKHYGLMTLYYKELTVYTKELLNDDPNYNADYTSQSSYNGLLEGKNVITIMAESLQDYAICEELTPNLYKLQQDGLYFKNNYSVNKTNMSEQIGIAGSNYDYDVAKYSIDFSIPNILNNEYKTTYIHDNAGDFYSRDMLMANYNFENVYYHSDLYPDGYKDDLYPDGLPFENGTWHWSGDYVLDSLTIEKAMPYLISEDELFYSFWTTLSMHGPYDGTYYSNKKLFEKLGYFEKVYKAEKSGRWTNPLYDNEEYKAYLEFYECCAIDLDIAIGKLLDELKSKNLLDDTLLVIYGDHEVYYHDIYLKMANTSDLSQVDKLYQTTMIMYNPKLNNKYLHDNGTTTITTFASPHLVCPTILDLIGAFYDRSWYLNYSFFDERYIPIFYSTQQKAFMDNVFYTVDLEHIMYKANDTSDQDLFLYNCSVFLDRLVYIENLYKNCRL